MSKDKCCGNCKHFDGVIEGVAWCPLCLEYRTDNEEECVWHHPRNNGWTEITPDNVDDALKDKEMLVIAHCVDERLIKEIIPSDIDNNQLEKILSTMAELGSYYYYVLPELKLEESK